MPRTGACLTNTFKMVGKSKKTSLYPGFKSQPIRVNVEEFVKAWKPENLGR